MERKCRFCEADYTSLRFPSNALKGEMVCGDCVSKGLSLLEVLGAHGLGLGDAVRVVEEALERRGQTCEKCRHWLQALARDARYDGSSGSGMSGDHNIFRSCYR